MNLHQAAHGDREFGFIAARLRLERKVVVGHWADPRRPGPDRVWARAACARHDWEGGRIARFGDNMREVAVTDGDKVEAQRRLGFCVNGVRRRRPRPRRVDATSDAEVDRARRDLPRRVRRRHRSCARRRSRTARCATARGSSSGCARSSRDGGFIAFTDTFEDLHGLTQLPGLAVQRLMARRLRVRRGGRLEDRGDGPGDEGHGRRPARRRVVHGGLHLPPRSRQGDRILGAHMLEVCQSIAGGAASPRDPSAVDRRQGRPGPARVRRPSRAPRSSPASPTWATGSGWSRPSSTSSRREQPLPRLPVARAMWTPRPDLRTNAAAWILAGGSHHTSLGYALTAEHLRDFAAMPAGSSCSSSTRRPSSTASATRFAGTTSTTTSPGGCEEHRRQRQTFPPRAVPDLLRGLARGSPQGRQDLAKLAVSRAGVTQLAECLLPKSERLSAVAPRLGSRPNVRSYTLSHVVGRSARRPPDGVSALRVIQAKTSLIQGLSSSKTPSNQSQPT